MEEKEILIDFKEFLYEFQRIFTTSIAIFFILNSLVFIFTRYVLVQKFDYVVWLESASVQGSEGMSGGASLFSSRNKISNQYLDVATKYLEFEFIDNPAYAENSNFTSRLIDVSPVEGTEVLQLVVRSTSLSESKKFFKLILGDLEGKLNFDVKKILQITKLRLSKIKVEMAELENEGNAINKMLDEVGFNPAILEKKNSNLEQRLSLEQEIFRLENSLALGKTRPFRVISHRPVSSNPSAPSLRINLVILNVILFFAFFMYLFIRSIRYQSLSLILKDKSKNTRAA